MTKDKKKIKFVCEACGYESIRWLGKCPGCGNFNTLVEEFAYIKTYQKHSTFSIDKPKPITEISLEKEERFITPIQEFNRVLGGGIVPGSLVLIGGDPGIGKSTLLLQISTEFAKNIGTVLYISGEESPKQIKLRAERLEVQSSKLYLVSETNLQTILEHINTFKPSLVVIDSIQTIFHEDIPSVPGSISQVKECTARLMHTAKSLTIPIFIIGHVTKEGVIAGPRVLEHIVDTVLYLEGERHLIFRILRAVKNRFGATDELGVFEMMDKGLREVLNPSEVFLSEKPKDVCGSVVIASIEGTRPILLELQALVTSSGLGIPRRQTLGLDYNRVAIILAVLEKRVGLHLSNQDVYVNLAGGVKVDEPAADLGVAIAVASSLKDIPVDCETVVFGEVGLTGEVRGINQARKRIKEASKLGFKKCIIPYSNSTDLENISGIEIISVKTVKDGVNLALKK